VKGACHTAVFCDGKVYIGGGEEGRVGELYGTASYRIDVYIPASNLWNPSINTPCCNFAMATLNNHLIIAGGRDRGQKVTNRVFMLKGNQVKKYPRMNTARCDATAVSEKRILVIAGGEDDQNQTLSTTELFDSITGHWYTTSDLPLPYSELKSVVVGNTIFMLGGYKQDGSYSPTVLIASLDTLSSPPSLIWKYQQNTPWCRSAPVNIHGGEILTVGGVKKTGTCYVRSCNIHIFNKVSRSWDITGQIPSARQALAAVSIADNKIILIGGKDDKDQHTNTVWIGLCEPQ